MYKFNKNMTSEKLFNNVCEKAKEFGLNAKNEKQNIIDPKGNTIIRENLGSEAFNKGTAYFGFINPEEDTTGPYSDFSFVVFPNSKENVETCVVCLGVGSLGFRNDYHLAALPGLRRRFLKLSSEDTYFKTSFDDIESTSSDLLKEVGENNSELRKVIEKYKTVLPASCIIKKIDEGGLNTLYSWLATYAKIRSWGTKKHQEKVEEFLPKESSNDSNNDENKVRALLEKRKYVVLQGAPGTGKTYMALKIAGKYSKVFFEQFHAETSFSDFVYGIEPNMSAKKSQLQFKAKQGILCRTIDYALKHEDERILLIIDEINRANLSNVLGPIFYLFEYQSGPREVGVRVGDKQMAELPANIDVIATMNTADRSLAVVDFALRRRFAWYTLRPHRIEAGEGQEFMTEEFNKFEDIFFRFATDDELNLQPGQSYFIVSKQESKAEMKDRMIFELLPLIKEYLAEGYLLKAKDAFCDLFLKETGKLMYE